MNEINKVTKHLEYLFLKKIISGLRNKEINEIQAKDFATNFLKLEPFNSIMELKNKILAFTNQHSYFKELSDYLIAYYEEKRISQVIEKMRKYIKNNEIDKALQIATKK